MARIFVIDDDEQLLRMVGLMLERGGHNITLINNPLDGLEQIKADKPDLLVLDVMMPTSQYDDPTIVALAFNSDGSLLAGSGENGALYLWETATGARRTIRERAGNPIWHLRFSADGTMLVTASQDTDVQIWGVPSGDS